MFDDSTDHPTGHPSVPDVNRFVVGVMWVAAIELVVVVVWLVTWRAK